MCVLLPMFVILQLVVLVFYFHQQHIIMIIILCHHKVLFSFICHIWVTHSYVFFFILFSIHNRTDSSREFYNDSSMHRISWLISWSVSCHDTMVEDSAAPHDSLKLQLPNKITSPHTLALPWWSYHILSAPWYHQSCNKITSSWTHISIACMKMHRWR